jgi:hypothetical protein
LGDLIVGKKAFLRRVDLRADGAVFFLDLDARTVEVLLPDGRRAESSRA